MFKALGDRIAAEVQAETGRAPDLSGWATERGLAFHDRENVVGYGFAVKPDWPDVRRNVVSGVLPGGAYGVAFHNVGKRVHTSKTSDKRPERWTTVGTFVPQAIAGFQRFAATAIHEPVPGWSEMPAASTGIAGRRLYCSPNADGEMITQVMTAGLGARLSALAPAVTCNYRYGLLCLSEKRLLEAPEIEALCVELSQCAALLRAGAPATDGAALEHGLPAPYWISPADVPGHAIAPSPPWQTHDNDGVGLDQPLSQRWMALATAIGTTYPEAGWIPEDALAFYRAFPTFPVPGQAVVVARGLLPGTGLRGRLVILADNYPDSFNFGLDAYMVCAPGAADTPGPWEQAGTLRCAVRDGWACAWRERAESEQPVQVDPRSYGELAAQVAALATQRGWG